MGLLQAVAAAAEVAAAAAAAAVSAASINHLSSPSPVWDEGLPRCPRSPFSPSPPPPQSTARKTLHFRGGAKRARPASCPSRSGAGPQGACAAPLHRPPPPNWVFCFGVGGGALGIRCGVSAPRPVRFRPFLQSAQEPGRGGAKLTTPLWPRLFRAVSPGPVSAQGDFCSHCIPGGEQGPRQTGPGQSSPFRRE